MRTLMQKKDMAGKVWAGPTLFPIGNPPVMQECQYLVDEDGLFSCNEEDMEAAKAAGFVPYTPPPSA